MDDNTRINNEGLDNSGKKSYISISTVAADEKTIGKVSPFCKTEIKNGDEVIVCPACGIPHHKGCWDENKGCTTFGCKEHYYESQGTNPTDVCQNCGATLGEGQDFCPKCGTPKSGVKNNVCGKCGAELQDGQEFCPKCGQKAGLLLDNNVNSAISQFNENLDKKKVKKKKHKVLPIVLVIILLVVGVVGYFTYSTIQEEKAEEAADEYKETAESFYSAVISSGSSMETIGNAIHDAWYTYIYSDGYTYYNGTVIYSADSAVNAAKHEQSNKISSVESADSSIYSSYKSLLTIPDPDNQELQEIKEAVKDVYDEYQNMYDCVISPSGNYSAWTSEFSSVDSSLAEATSNLNDLLN